jgi:predicted nucleotide-binding protein
MTQKELFLKQYLDSLKKDESLNLLSIEQISEYSKNLINNSVNKTNYCEKTYVKPRLERVPDRLLFLDELINNFEDIIQKDFKENYQKWCSGDYYFLTSNGQFDFAITNEGIKIIDKDIWFNVYEKSIQIIFDDKLIEFLDELRYFIYLKIEKRNLLLTEIQTTKPNEIIMKQVANAFLVHGRDEVTKQTVARFLEHLKIKPIILSEQGGIKGILEKIEMCSDVDFAVVLLTPDDEGNLLGEEKKPRSRQNVIFELGYFIAKLKKEKVIVLIQDNIEKPSDYDGIMYINYDNHNGWKLKLAKEIKTTGINIDLNELL